MTSSVSASDANYDPMKDPKQRPTNSNDPAWQYGYWTTIGNRDFVTCNLRGKVTKGGATRLKQHLAGGYADILVCSKTTEALRQQMHDYFKKNKRSRPIFLEEDEGAEEVEGLANQNATTSSLALAVPSSATAAKRRATSNFKAPATKDANPKETKTVAPMIRKTPEEIVDERRSGQFQSTMERSTKSKEDKHYVDMQWALWFYECGIPFNAVASRQFEIACEVTAQYGLGYKPMSKHMLREPLLQDCVKETSKMKVDHELAWKHYGCTLMSDGWTDRRGRHLINFLVNSMEGTYFLESVDASSEAHDATMLADLLDKRIEIIGKDKVVQVVTNNGANYKAVGKLLMERIPTLYWTPCAAHCLDLMLEDIKKLKEFKKPIARARLITTFIYRHGRLLSAMREKTGGKDLVRPAATRFATVFLTLKSMYSQRDALRCLFVSEAWTGIKLSTTMAGQNVSDIVLSKEFWTSLEDCLRASAPLLIVLRAVDGDEKPAMPEVSALMTHAKEKINLSFPTQNKKNLLKKIIVEMMLLLLRGCFTDVLAKIVEDDQIRNNIDRQAILYENQRGDAFSNKMAIANKEKMVPSARGCDITWDDVDEAVGASHSIRGCNVPRRAHNRADPITFQWRSRNSAMVEEDEEAYVQSDQEDDEEDPHDDANVSDCDEAPGGTEDGEGSMDATNNLNEFDDDF
ncbi:uncharacterized protein LOC102714944 [Oryza brachyantha]|uniref:uncharacterized protein LOC102714944 n=1 Tax=Oryza brachyantha TaxID=4533 RepID=UPI001ADA4562|nr:uncharacterized protein LOC102714944 [Oryza brachyantha]